MNVLSLFDGISCGQLALKRAGVTVDNYYASEIDGGAMSITNRHFDKTIQVGDVTTLDTKTLPQIDLVMGGSPCQGFSVAGKQLNFDDPRSKLFFQYERVLKELNPKYFLLENVRMDKECLALISERLGVKPVCINSAYYSAQSRERFYWTNIPFTVTDTVSPLTLSDIVEVSPSPDLYVKTILPLVKKAKHGPFIKQLGYFKSDKQGWRIYDIDGKSPTLLAESGGLAGPSSALIWQWEAVRKLSVIEAQRLQTLPEGYTDGLARTKQMKAIGNGWTVDVIANIFKGIQ